MPSLQQRGQDFCLVFSKEEVAHLNLSLRVPLEVVPYQKGFLILFETGTDAKAVKNPAVPTESIPSAVFASESVPLSPSSISNPLDEKIFARLADTTVMARRMVGTFENSLSSQELKRFEELLKEGAVESFKSNEKYRIPIYRVKPSAPAQRQAASSSHKTVSGEMRPEELTISKNGFMIASNEQTAKEVSAQFNDRMKAGELRGIKGFDGSVYFIETKLYVEYSAKILDFFRSHATATVDEVGSALKVSGWLVRVACEFLKDDSLLIEKKKGLFKVID